MMHRQRSSVAHAVAMTLVVLVGGLLLAGALGGCSEKSQPPDGASTPPVNTDAGGTKFCDFKAGEETAPVKVEAFYPGRHEDTLAAVKSLSETFPGKVCVEIVDWRREEGLKRRQDAGLSCAGVMINGTNAFDLEIDGKKTKVLFERGIDGQWTKAELEAAVRQLLPPEKKE